VGYFCDYHVTARGKQSPVGRKLGQSGHPTLDRARENVLKSSHFSVFSFFDFRQPFFFKQLVQVFCSASDQPRSQKTCHAVPKAKTITKTKAKTFTKTKTDEML
jgi:hypothetical protein